jgi:hypothetical protein
VYFLVLPPTQKIHVQKIALEHSPHIGMRYGEIPKSCTMDARQNMEHQLYATIQRKQPPIPPFNGATIVSKGFDTIDRLKMVR